MHESKYILGVETTCDETSLGLVKDGTDVIEEITLSQAKKHAKYGGVVPELAAREHIKNLSKLGPTFFSLIEKYIPKISAVAVAAKIGLPPAVQVGEAYAVGLSKALGVPLIEINHVIAHIWGVWVDSAFYPKPEFPVIGVILSGGHSIIAKFNSPRDYKILGQTLDDAAGESFDKVAALMELGYPGGPIIEEYAKYGDEYAYEFPVPMKDSDNYDLSFSGLKTAVRYFYEDNIRKVPEYMHKYFKQDIAAAFQRSLFMSIAYKVRKAVQDTGIKNIVLGGGVAANQRLLDILYNQLKDLNVVIYAPHLRYCGDNASLIAGYAYNFLPSATKKR